MTRNLKQCHPLIRTRNRAEGGKNRLRRAGAGADARAKIGRVRYIIIGAGAVGGTIGGCLARAGHEFVLPARGAHLGALRRHGLRLSTPSGTDTVAAPAIGGTAEIDLRPGHVPVGATKAQNSLAVLTEWAGRPVAGGGSAAQGLPVICAQNGVANERFALRRFRRVYGMCVWLPAAPPPPPAGGRPVH